MRIPTLLTAAALALTAQTGMVLAMAHEAKPVNLVEFDGVKYYSDAGKMTLYTFDKDEKNLSNCYGDCAAKWPPLVVEDAAMLPKKFGTTTRTDGTLQATYKGQPLYLWFKDEKPGDMTGDGFKGVWHIAKP
ncbi:MAG: COG4315 family predicted lipoprotein [Marinibacterium sp.]